MLFDKDAGHTLFMEDIYECQSRLPGTNWTAATVPWTDVVRLLLIHFRAGWPPKSLR